MRIPVGSCAGCSGNRSQQKLYTGGYHAMGNGNWLACAFVKAEMVDFPNDKLLGVFQTRIGALKHANKNNGSLLWSGQGPREMWLVVAPLDSWAETL